MKKPKPKAYEWHGGCYSPEYHSWQSMRDRCYNPNNVGFVRYGGRGIRVCDRWNASFSAFMQDMGPRPTDGHSIDRKNNDGNYEPLNCRWATDLEQNNNSTNVHWLEQGGIRDSVTGWAARLGCDVRVLYVRINNGWPTNDVLAPPFCRERPKRGSKRYTHDGITDTIPGWSKRTGIPRTTLGMRLRDGWDPAKAFTEKVMPHGDPRRGAPVPSAPIEFRGIINSARGWDRWLGFPPGTVSQRLRNRWSVERALTEPNK
jgi:hypothetical protein